MLTGLDAKLLANETRLALATITKSDVDLKQVVTCEDCEGEGNCPHCGSPDIIEYGWKVAFCKRCGEKV